MKVLHVIHHLWMGGAQRLLSDIVPIMKTDIEVAVLVTQRANNEFSKKLEKEGIDIISMDVKNIHNPVIVYKIARIIRNYDVVHAHLFPSLYMVAFASIFSRVPLVYTEHSTYNQRRAKWYLRPIEKFVYRRYSRVISISEHTQNQLKKWLNAKGKDERFVVINNGVNLTAFELEREYKTEPDTLIMISRFAHSKDQATVIRAMTLLPNSIKLIFVGSGETMPACKDLSKQLGLEQRIQFTGAKSDIASWISKADIGVQSSVWEGFGLTAVELMAGGVPVVASDVDGLKQVVEGAGVVFHQGDEKELANIIKELVNNHTYYKEVKERCVKRAKLYDIHKMADKYIAVYKDILN